MFTNAMNATSATNRDANVEEASAVSIEVTGSFALAFVPIADN
jgi:hypothetical protein